MLLIGAKLWYPLRPALSLGRSIRGRVQAGWHTFGECFAPTYIDVHWLCSVTIPTKSNLADVLAMMAHGEPDQEVLDALTAAELELRAFTPRYPRVGLVPVRVLVLNCRFHRAISLGTKKQAACTRDSGTGSAWWR
jgi:hypothetical protein